MRYRLAHRSALMLPAATGPQVKKETFGQTYSYVSGLQCRGVNRIGGSLASSLFDIDALTLVLTHEPHAFGRRVPVAGESLFRTALTALQFALFDPPGHEGI